jgi:hypothetical protein
MVLAIPLSVSLWRKDLASRRKRPKTTSFLHAAAGTTAAVETIASVALRMGQVSVEPPHARDASVPGEALQLLRDSRTTRIIGMLTWERLASMVQAGLR